MQFIYFKSMRVGINLDHVEWYSLDDAMTNMTFKMVSGQKFFTSNEDEILYFLDVEMLMETEE